MGAPPTLRIRLLGGFRTERPTGVPPAERWPRPGARTLVKLLALAPGHQLHREHLMAECWPHAELPAAQRNLRVALHAARHALEPELTPRAASSYVVADGSLLRLAPGRVVVDADRAGTLAERALSGGDTAQLAAALDAFTGDLLPEDRYAPWAEPHRTRLAELRVRVALALARARLDAGDAERAAAVARLVLESAPADERAHRVLIGAYLRQGMRSAAARQYEQCAAAMDFADLGARPAPETTRLYRAALGHPPEPEPEADAARVRVALARTLERSGRYADAVHVLREALASYELQHSPDACTLTAARLAEVLSRATTPDEARATLAGHPPRPDAAPDVHAAHRMAESVILFNDGEYEAGLAAARGAEELLRADGREALPARPGPPWASAPPGAADAATAGRLAQAAGQRRPDRQAEHAALLARSLAQQAACHGLLGRNEEAIAPAERALAPAEESGDPALLATVLSVLRENARRSGRHRKALEHGRRALTLAEQAGRPTATAFERANLAELHLLLGEADEAEQLAGAAVGLAEPFGGTVLAFALTALARVRAATDPDSARSLLDRAERCAHEGGHRQAVDEVCAARAELAGRRRG
ncbi:BTAD domain-containing putative transcriptional regulator [Streptomyces sp. NPDC021622]|uniref:BTAD domain-containing putative transcriptional regulator n=1 Tax=Streptomyces sp. NPDC021622 TaxID=3155013 RepID=UPI0033C3C817